MASFPIPSPRLPFCFAALLLVLLAGPCGVSAQTPRQTPLTERRVLVLTSNEASTPLFEDTQRALTRTLEAGGLPRLNQYFYALDLRQHPDPAYRQALVELMRVQHDRRRVDLIVTLQAGALAFVQQESRALFPHTPILALYLPVGMVPSDPGRVIVWHAFEVDVAGTLEMALRLVPGVQHVFVVTGMDPGDREREAQARRALRRWENRLEFRYLSSLPGEDVLTTLAGAPPHSLVLFVSYGMDARGQPYTAPGFVQQMRAVSAAPIFGVLASALGHGLVGGALVDYDRIGTKAGQLALDILRGGTEAGNVTQVLNAPPIPMFDWRELRRWNLSVDALPAGSIVINREYTLWEQYRAWAIAIGAALLLQALVIAALLIQRRERQQAEAAQRVSEEKFVKAFAGNAAGIALTRLDDGAILDVNYTALQLLGYSRDEVLGRPATDFEVWADPADRNRCMEALRTTGRVRGWEMQLMDREGKCLDVLLSAEMIKVAGERLILSTFLDLTERHRVEREAAQFRRELTHVSRVALMGELTASLAHELKQPLTAIATNAHAGQRFLAQSPPAVDDVREILTDVAADAKRAGEVIDRLRGLLKKDQSRFHPLDLNELIREVVGLTRTDAIIRHQPITLALAADAPKVMADSVLLQQVLLNLVLNAMDAMVAQPPTERLLTIRTAIEGSAVRVGVQDRGSGIPSDQLDQIFTAFVTTKRNGMGMGLAISRSIVEAHGGRIWAENNHEGGATFSFTLPAA